MPFVVGGAIEETPFHSLSWKEDKRLRLTKGDFRARIHGKVAGIVLHTTRGIPGGKDRRPQDIRPGMGPSTDGGARVNEWWTKDGRDAGTHLVVDFDGVAYCCADLLNEATFHAGSCNERTIGIEIVQGSAAQLYDGQLDAVVSIVDYLTLHFGIQRQIPAAYRGRPAQRLVDGGKDFIGVWGHRDCSSNRGVGDPGSAIMEKLVAAGYERFDLDAGEDLAAWKQRQAALGCRVQDGIPGHETYGALLRTGRPAGLWVERPTD